MKTFECEEKVILESAGVYVLGFYHTSGKDVFYVEIGLRTHIQMLLIFDLNNTLVYRQYKNDNKALEYPTPDFIIRDFHVWKRPGLDTFIQSCFQQTDVDIAVWTSAFRYNAIPVVEAIFGQFMNRLKFVYCREECSNVRNTNRDHSSAKDLQLVWDRFPDYNAFNTRVLEDSTEKYSPCFHHLITLVRKWTPDMQDDTELSISKQFL